MSLRFLKKLDSKQMFECQRMTHEIWGDGFSLEFRFEKLLQQINFAQGRILSMVALVNEQDQVLCSMKRYSLALAYQNENIPTIGMGAIFTPEQERGRGLAKLLIQYVLEDAQQSGIDTTLLFSDISPRYYEQFGFVELLSQKMSIQTSDLPSGTSALAFRKAASVDLTKLISYFDRIFAPNCIRYARDPETWKFFRDRSGPDTDYILSHSGKDVGYVSLSIESGTFYLNEFFVPAEMERDLLALLRELAQKAGVLEIRGNASFQKLEGLKKTFERPKKAIPMIRSSRLDLGSSWFGYLDEF